MLKASIVVPIYNAGAYIDRCAPSLTRQSIGEDAYEVIYVDDGSTDDSAKRLHLLAEKYAHVRVYEQENSGWPGKPRNVGIRMARGAYVHFVDQDDELAPEALERLYALAVRNNSDIVFGKAYGDMQGPGNIFRHTREDCSVRDTELFETLTPHKMFRRDFLLEHGIEFPEGRVRLEDQLFLARAYPLAKTVSILGDYPAYHWQRRDDGGNNSQRPPSPEDYYGHLRNVVRAVKERSEPGPVQDRMLRRNYRVEILRPLTEPRVIQRTGRQLERYYRIVRALALEEFPPGVAAGFPAVPGLRARLLEDDRLDGLVEFSRRIKDIRLHVEVGAAGWRRGILTLPIKVWLIRADGRPVALARRPDGRLLLDPELLDGIPGVTEWEVKDPFAYAHGEVLVKDTRRSVYWYAANDLRPRLEPLGDGLCHVVLEADAVIDPLTMAGGQPLDAGRYELWMDVQLLGLGRRPRVTLPEGARRAGHPARRAGRLTAVGKPARMVVASWNGPGGQLQLRVAPQEKLTLRRAVLLRAASDDRVRTAYRRLPDSTRSRLRRSLDSTVPRF